jgi:hypothetical protein
MNPNARGDRKLAHLIRYGSVALIAAWSLLAIAGYAILGTIGGWMASLSTLDGWVALTGELLGQAGGPAIGIIWFIGMLAILGVMALMRRFAA